MIKKTLKSGAFTLAEVFVVLVIVGVLSALLIPGYVNNSIEKANDAAKDIFLKRIQEALNQMNMQNAMAGYSTNEAFVDNLEKYVKIEKRCVPEDYEECFVSKFRTSSGQEISTSTLQTSKNFKMFDNELPLSGVMLANGTSIIMAYNPECVATSKTNVSADKTYCMSMIYDINAKSGPNIIGKDISLLNASISSCSGVEIGSLCVSAPISFAAATEAPIGSGNYWAGARMVCEAMQMSLPSQEQLASFKPYKTELQLDNGSNYWASGTVGVGWSANGYYYYEGGPEGTNVFISKDDSAAKAVCVK